MRGRAFAVARICAVAFLFCGAAAKADSFPSSKIRIVVPTAAAGVADSLARIVGAKVQDNIGQTVYVEDRPGANGNVGAQVALSAPADGYTIMMGHIGRSSSASSWPLKTRNGATSPTRRICR